MIISLVVSRLLVFSFPDTNIIIPNEITASNIKAITKTLNSEGSLVKVVVNDENVSCVLTSMRGIDLNNIMEELHEKMLKYDANFEEKVEYKEY